MEIPCICEVKVSVSGGGETGDGDADAGAVDAGASEGEADAGGSLAGPPTFELGEPMDRGTKGKDGDHGSRAETDRQELAHGGTLHGPMTTRCRLRSISARTAS